MAAPLSEFDTITDGENGLRPDDLRTRLSKLYNTIESPTLISFNTIDHVHIPSGRVFSTTLSDPSLSIDYIVVES